jgi:hypothetical protein
MLGSTWKGRPSCRPALALIRLDTRAFDQVEPWARLFADQSSTTDQLSNVLVGYPEFARRVLNEHIALERHAG